MTTPADHYMWAEKILDRMTGETQPAITATALATTAQAHATLALAGAVGLITASALLDGEPPSDPKEAALLEQAARWIAIASDTEATP